MQLLSIGKKISFFAFYYQNLSRTSVDKNKINYVWVLENFGSYTDLSKFHLSEFTQFFGYYYDYTHYIIMHSMCNVILHTIGVRHCNFNCISWGVTKQLFLASYPLNPEYFITLCFGVIYQRNFTIRFLLSNYEAALIFSTFVIRFS